MDTAPVSAVFDFEVYLLMTMKIVMVNAKQAQLLEVKLAEHGLSVRDAERLHKWVAESLGDEDSRFEDMKKLLAITDQDSSSLKYSSVLWPGFEFNAMAGEDGQLESARYRHTRRDSLRVDSPIGLPVWSMDVTEFAERFGPMTAGQQWPLFDKLLPAHEGHEFEWKGIRYGAAFSWGLFLFVSELWE